MAAPVCCSFWFGLLAEKFFQQAFCALETFLREDHRFRFPARISDVSLLVQAIHGFPIEALPCPRSIMKAEIQQREYGIIALVRIKVDAFASYSGAAV